MGSATVRTGLDASALQDHASTNYGKSGYLYVRGGTPAEYAYLWFKNAAPAGSTILSATLRLYGQGAWGAGTVPMTVQRAASAWVESQLTWLVKPAGYTSPATTVTQANPTAGTEWAFDVTALVQQLCDGAANYGLRVTTSDTTRRNFYSLDNPDTTLGPTLDVTWSDAPDAPHTLSPSGGRAVAPAKPVLRFDYHDVSGSVTLAAVQVQVDAAGDFTSPGFDSGTVASSTPELDLSTTSYAGLSAGSSTQWRVRVQDAAGLWSDWSDPATFSRVTQGTLTISNPADAPDNVVSDFTPPLIWALSAATQTAWRVTLANAAAPTKFLADTGRRAGADTEYTPAKGVITDQSATYALTVQTWDDADREATPGDPGYVQAQRTFTFDATGAHAPVASLTAAATTAGWPWMTLAWERSTAPDGFNVVRDGGVVDSGLDPADLLVGGTSYAYVDRAPAGNTVHEWSVQAVVDGVASADNPTVTGQTFVPAIWLLDPDSDRLAPILLDTGQPSFTMPDLAGVYEPIGADHVVRIVQTQRGLEGGIAGTVTDYAGGTAADWAAHLLWFKQHPSAELRLLIGDQSLRVLVGNLTLAPAVGGADITDRAVSFDFWSLDGPA